MPVWKILLLVVAVVFPAVAVSQGKPPDLSNPRSSLQNFIDSARAGDYDRAARSLDLSSYSKTADLNPSRLAWKLKVVLDQTLWLDWTEVPNQANGLFPEDGPQKAKPEIVVGRIPAGQRDVSFTMHRVDRGGGPVWLISPRVVEQIDVLYRQHGLGVLGEYIPMGLQRFRLLEVVLWQWIGLVVFAVAAWLGAHLVRWIGMGIAVKAWRFHREEYRKTLHGMLDRPVVLTAAVVIFQILVTTLLGLAEPVRDWLDPLLFVALVLCVAWLMSRALTITAQVTIESYGARLSERDAVRARVLRTQVNVMRRVISFLIALIAIGIALSQFHIFRTLGASLLASAGLAGIVMGLAAQRTMSNLFAGIQLALTSPVRLGDSVVFEGEWGWIEEITNTYVVIRIWDLRRLVVPINYLLDHPIQNWTRTSSDLLGTVFIYTDYRCPIDALRGELKKICESTELWDGKVQLIQVTDCKQETLEVRALCSARDAGTAWDLRCHVRERLIAFLQQFEEGHFLPRTRVELYQDGGPDKRHGADLPADLRESHLRDVMEQEEQKQREREEKRKREHL